MKCPRCGDVAFVLIGSWFEPVDICLPCRYDEGFTPNYIAARQAERQADLDDVVFHGLGLAPEDVAVLTARREKRA